MGSGGRRPCSRSLAFLTTGPSSESSRILACSVSERVPRVWSSLNSFMERQYAQMVISPGSGAWASLSLMETWALLILPHAGHAGSSWLSVFIGSCEDCDN